MATMATMAGALKIPALSTTEPSFPSGSARTSGLGGAASLDSLLGLGFTGLSAATAAGLTVAAAATGYRAHSAWRTQWDDDELSNWDFCPLYSSLRRVPAWSTGNRGTRRLHVLGSSNGTPVDGNSVSVSSPASTTIRSAREVRNTKETNVDVTICLDGSGVSNCGTGIPFLDHMLDQITSHGLLDLTVKAQGDIHIDDHHTNEDVALALGTALSKALGSRTGIYRFGDFSAPLDEALVHVALDLSGRPHLSYDVSIPTERVGQYDTQLVEHFFQSLANTSGMTLHIRQLSGKNSHHIIEAMFKAFARALRQAVEIDPRRVGRIPSSKGVLSRT